MIHVERSVVADVGTAVYGTVGWLRYVAHGMAVMVSSSAWEVWVVVPGCLLGWLGLWGWAACLGREADYGPPLRGADELAPGHPVLPVHL